MSTCEIVLMIYDNYHSFIVILMNFQPLNFQLPMVEAVQVLPEGGIATLEARLRSRGGGGVSHCCPIMAPAIGANPCG